MKESHCFLTVKYYTDGQVPCSVIIRDTSSCRGWEQTQRPTAGTLSPKRLSSPIPPLRARKHWGRGKRVFCSQKTEKYEVIFFPEREAFLFCLFKHLCPKGFLCQYQDVLKPYVVMAELIYEDLVSVQKHLWIKENINYLLSLKSQLLALLPFS